MNNKSKDHQILKHSLLTNCEYYLSISLYFNVLYDEIK